MNRVNIETVTFEGFAMIMFNINIKVSLNSYNMAYNRRNQYKPPLTATSLQRPLFFGPGGQKFHTLTLLVQTSLQRPLSSVPKVAGERFNCIFSLRVRPYEFFFFSSSPLEGRLQFQQMMENGTTSVHLGKTSRVHGNYTKMDWWQRMEIL